MYVYICIHTQSHCFTFLHCCCQSMYFWLPCFMWCCWFLHLCAFAFVNCISWLSALLNYMHTCMHIHVCMSFCCSLNLITLPVLHFHIVPESSFSHCHVLSSCSLGWCCICIFMLLFTWTSLHWFACLLAACVHPGLSIVAATHCLVLLPFCLVFDQILSHWFAFIFHATVMHIFVHIYEWACPCIYTCLCIYFSAVLFCTKLKENCQSLVHVLALFYWVAEFAFLLLSHSELMFCTLVYLCIL